MLTPIQAGEPSTVDCLEGETPRYTATLTDDLGVALPAASLTTLTLTLYVIKTDGTVGYVNSRNAQKSCSRHRFRRCWRVDNRKIRAFSKCNSKWN
mgnify:CR=1 FL=1